jgi:hypothetical protein
VIVGAAVEDMLRLEIGDTHQGEVGRGLRVITVGRAIYNSRAGKWRAGPMFPEIDGVADIDMAGVARLRGAGIGVRSKSTQAPVLHGLFVEKHLCVMSV